VENVTDRTSNPFGMRIEDAVYGYGDDNAAFHVVGDRPLEYALREHTNHWADLPHDATELYAEEVRGRGFLVVPVADQDEWTAAQERALTGTLA
jgi:hypothetical protein